MKTTALITLPKAALVKNNALPVKRKRLLSMEELDENAAMVEKLWEMYNLQLKRTHEMMVLCEAQREELEQTKLQLRMLTTARTEVSPRKERERKLETITYDEIERLGKNIQTLFAACRISFAYALVKMLHTLKQLKGSATPQQLFSAAEITEVSGYRYAERLKAANFIIYNPTNKTGYYEITVLGKKFLAGEIKDRQDMEKMKKEWGYEFTGNGYSRKEIQKELKSIHERNKRKGE